jgi:hypothetical protein
MIGAGNQMRESVIDLIEVRGRRGDWTGHDLAQLHRAASVLRHLGRPLEADGGMTDEGEPWFAVYHAQSGEVVTHFARIDGWYIVCAPFLNGSLRGRVLCELIGHFLDRYRALAGPAQRPLGGRNGTARLWHEGPKNFRQLSRG